MDKKYFEQPWNMGVFLHDRRLAVVPGTVSRVITGEGIITICEAVPYDPIVKDRPRFTFWSYKELNSVGDSVEYLSSMAEEKLLPKTAYFTEPTYSTKIFNT